MKKLINILLLSGMMLSLCGCVSQKDYKDLEKRVEYLEQRQGIVQTSYIENNQNNKVNEANSNTWSLERMSADEIYNECITLSKSIKTGDDVSNFQLKFRSNIRQNDNYLNFYFDNYYNRKELNCIQYIFLNNAIVEMNNTYTIKQDSKIIIDMYLIDYNTAANLYDKIYTYLKSLNFGNLDSDHCTDSRDGSSWGSNITYERRIVDRNDVVYQNYTYTIDDDVYYYEPNYSISLTKSTNPNIYEIRFELPIINE